MIEQDLGQIIPDITATATVDNTTGTPEVNITVDEIEELGKLINKFKFSFLHMKGEKGDKPQKGVDYYTPQEKEQFTTETKALVTGEGSKQVSLINAETTKVIQQIREIVVGNEATSNAITLSGKTRLEFEKETQGVAGGFSGTFPLTQATLNGVYLVPATGKFYVCTTAYNGGNLTAPNSNFEELSVWKNRDKLENLFKKYLDNFHITYVNEVKNKNLNEIVYNSIYFGYWDHKCTGLPENDIYREFVLLTISFNRYNNENSRPGNTAEEKSTGYGFQIFVSVDEKISFRVFDWVTQKYLNWHTISFIE